MKYFVRLSTVLMGGIIVSLLVTGCRTSREAPAPLEQHQSNSETPAALTAADVRKTLAETAKSFPDDPGAQLELAMFDMKTNTLDIAEQEMVACWKQFPRYARAPYQLGVFYLTHGRTTEALRCLQGAAALKPDDVQLQCSAGQAYFQLGDEKRAIAYAKNAIAIDPQASEPYLLLARCYDHHGTADRGIANLQLYLQRSGNPAPGYYVLGRIYTHLADRAHAEEYLQRAVQADPNNAEYWIGLGRVYFELFNAQKAQNAIQCYEKALAIEPNNWAAHQYLGHALLDQQQYETAVLHLRAALQNCPDPGPLYYDLSQTLLKAGHEEEGRKALATYQGYRTFHDGVTRLNKAIVAAPKDRTLRYALVRFCLDHNQITAAQSVLDEIIRQQGTDPTLERLQAEVKASRVLPPPPSSNFDLFSGSALPGNPLNTERMGGGIQEVKPTPGSADSIRQEGASHGN